MKSNGDLGEAWEMALKMVWCGSTMEGNAGKRRGIRQLSSFADDIMHFVSEGFLLAINLGLYIYIK